MKTNKIMRFFGSVALLSLLGTGGAWAGNPEDPPGGTEPEPDSLPTVYQSFFEGNPVYKQVGENQTLSGYDIPIFKRSLEGDTVVDGSLYHKLSVELGHGVERNEQFWVRESESHDKVWVRLPWDSDGQEFLVVDMTLSEGDTFVMDSESEKVRLSDTTREPDGSVVIRYKDTVICKETCYEVDSVYYLGHPGGVLKHIRLRPQDDNRYTRELEGVSIYSGDCAWRSRHLEFIEGVGSNLGFVYHRLGISYRHPDSLWNRLSPMNGYESPVDYIVCMERYGTVFYEHPNAECMDCDASLFDRGMDEVGTPYPPVIPPVNESVRSLSRYLQASPNPASAQVTLRWAEATDGRVERTACRIELYSVQGVKLRTMTTGAWPYTFTVASLPSGAYLLRVVPAEAPAPEAAWQATVRLMVK